MVGLIIKDFYAMFKQTKFFMALAVVMVMIPSDFVFGYSVFYAAMLPITALSYDEQAKWNQYADMFPYSASVIVGSKYVIGYLSVGVIALFVLIAKAVMALLGFGAMGKEMFFSLGLVVCGALFVQALNLAFIFWLGVEKGRLLFVAITVAGLMSIVGFLQDIDPLLGRFQISIPVICLGVAGITAAVNLISFFAAKALYQHKRR